MRYNVVHKTLPKIVSFIMSRVPSPPTFPFSVSLKYEPPKRLRGQVHGLMKPLATLLHGHLQILHGVAMQGPLDGFTVYYDVYGSGGVATTYEGLTRKPSLILI